MTTLLRRSLILPVMVLLAACSALSPQPTPTPEPTSDEVSPPLTETASAEAAATEVAAASTETATAQHALDQQATNSVITATAGVRRTATASIRATGTPATQALLDAYQAVLDTGTENSIIALSQAMQAAPPVFGPEDGSIPHDANNDYVEVFWPDVRTRNFALRVEFVVPYAKETGDWDLGVFFRELEGNDSYRIAIASTGYWELDDWNGGINRFAIDQDGFLTISTAKDVRNRVLVVVFNERGVLILNNTLISRLDVSRRNVRGTLEIATGMYEGDEVPGKETAFEGLTIWQLPEE